MSRKRVEAPAEEAAPAEKAPAPPPLPADAIVAYHRVDGSYAVELADGTRRPWNRRADPPPPLEPTIEVDKRTCGAYQPLRKPASSEPYAEEGLGGMTDRQAAGL